MNAAGRALGALALGAGLLSGAPGASAHLTPPDDGSRPICTLMAPGDLDPRGGCDGVRPGALVRSDEGSCSLNFLFTSPEGERFIGTAGHCVFPNTETWPLSDGIAHPDQVWQPGEGPEARQGGRRIGEYAYGVFTYAHDFALIRIDPDVPASAEMCHFGGPTGLYTEYSPKTMSLHHYGNGIGLGNTNLGGRTGRPEGDVATLPARSGIAWSSTSRSMVYGLLAADWGDSGSGVIDGLGRAVGALVHLTVMDPSSGRPATVGMTRIDHHIARAEEHLGFELTLATAPLRPGALPVG